MKYEKFSDKIFLRLDPGDEICEAILFVAKKEGIGAASITGIGATDDFTVGVFDLNEKKYAEYRFDTNHEINALSGNLTRKDGKPYVHLHITCTGKNAKVVGGHLLRGVVSLTAEIIIGVAEAEINRVFNEALGINVWDL